MSKLKVTLVHSPIGLEKSQRATCEALGLRRLHRTRVHNPSPAVLGMLHKVRHLVAVEKIEEDSSADS